MFIKIFVTAGPRKDDEFAIKGEILIGRSKGDLALRDQKISNPHAKIFSPEPGVVEIQDMGSSNGTFVNKEKITRVVLKVGDEITIGKTKLLVKELGAIPQPQVKASEEIDKGTWQETLDAVLAVAADVLDKKAPKTTGAAAFTPAVSLEFSEGIQTGGAYYYGFGPRLIGAYCVDGLLYEPLSPPVAFELFPNKDGSAQFTPKDSSVLLNGKTVQTEKLQDGDRISVGQTVIVFKGVKEA